MTPVEALLAVQEVPDGTGGRRRAAQRGFDMLDMLEQVRLGLLAGTIPRERLRALLRSVQDRSDSTDDPRLKTLLDKIELRASVELAKLGELQ